MDAKVLEALKGSIKKWENILANKEDDQGPLNCPLCHMFNTHAQAASSLFAAGGALATGAAGNGSPGEREEAYERSCVGCPVMEKTGVNFCNGTPYVDWEEYVPTGRVNSDEDRELAQAELNFLKSLLPPET